MMVVGHGSPVLVVPGIQGRWEWMRPAIEALSASHRVLTFSLTEAPSDANCFAEWDICIDRLLDRTGVGAVTLVGVSFGGLAALHYAARRPERVQALVLVSAPPPDWALDPWRRRCLRHPLLLAPVFAVRGAAHLVPEILSSQPTWLARIRVLCQHIGRILRFPASPARMAAWARAWQSQLGAIDCRRIAMPVLLITGEPDLDLVVPPAATLRYLDLLPQARHVFLKRTGHIGLVTRPEAFARIVGDFA
jgi:3-oxoadipate enol-lactonase